MPPAPRPYRQPSAAQNLFLLALAAAFILMMNLLFWGQASEPLLIDPATVSQPEQ